VIRGVKKYMAHDEAGSCAVGDLVRIVESRPQSRHKRWVVSEVLEKAG
jgi:small subunit ribosomal protein S17